MKRITYILLLVIGVTFLNSCKEDERDVDQIEGSKNLAAFDDVNSSPSFTRVANGSEYTATVYVKLTGPTASDVKSDISVTIGVDTEESTAIEGTHFRLSSEPLTLAANNNHLAKYEFTMLTAGIETPLPESPVVALKITQASGDGSVIASGKLYPVTLNYACPSYLEGWYACTMVRDGVDTYEYDDYITETGVGTYRTTEVGHWIGGLGVGTPGYTFQDVCGVLCVPQQYLVDYYSNIVQGTELGTVDEDGTLHITYSISSDSWSSVYENTYVPYPEK